MFCLFPSDYERIVAARCCLYAAPKVFHDIISSDIECLEAPPDNARFLVLLPDH
jgi:hypothetical protein